MKSFSYTFRSGFSLLELIVVISIIAIITAVSAIPYTNFVKNSRDSRRKVDLEQLRAALELYKSNSENGTYPGVSNYVDLAGELSPTYIKTLPEDPQPGKTYEYECNNIDSCTSYIITSNLESGQTYTIEPNGSAITDGNDDDDNEGGDITPTTAITITIIPTPGCGACFDTSKNTCANHSCSGGAQCQIVTASCTVNGQTNPNCTKPTCVGSSDI